MTPPSHQGERVSYGQRVVDLARLHPGKTALIVTQEDGSETRLTWKKLDLYSNRAARLLADSGADQDSVIAIGLPNSAEHVLFTLAAWKVGACAFPVRAALPEREREKLLNLAEPAVVVSDWEGVTRPTVGPAEVWSSDVPATPLADRVPRRFRAIASGGSTGTPKIVVSNSEGSGIPGGFPQALGKHFGFRPRQVQLVPTPLYHTNGFGYLHNGLFEDHTVVLMERFDASRAVELIEKHRVNFTVMVPTMLQRILRLPDLSHRDFSSLEALVHGGAPCPPWVKEAWFELLGPERCFEGYGTTEGIGIATVRGDEWLRKRGTVGRPRNAEIQILSEEGEVLPAGEVGEIFLRPFGADSIPFEYLGGDSPRVAEDSFASVGDLGWVDEEGYLFIADRRADLIITGGANVYPAEVEGAISEHPDVFDVAVIGVPDSEWGRRVHAVVRPKDPLRPPDAMDLDAHCRERLATYKVPKSYEFTELLPRDEGAGKMRRSALIADRSQGWTDSMIPVRRSAAT